MDGTTAHVKFRTDRDSDLVAAVYTEDGMKMLGSGLARVAEEDDSADVEIDIDEMPEYFAVGGYLLDAETHEPISDAFLDTYYTKDCQDIVKATAEDFPADRVLDLDGNSETNFLVFGEDTIMAREDDGKNVVTDNGDGTYTITNADERFLAMEPGDSFSAQLPDGTVLVAVAKAVKVSGTAVTVTEDPAAEPLLGPENLLFIAQNEAEEDGTLAFAYIPRAEVNGADATAYGPERTFRRGDVDRNGVVDRADRVYLARALASWSGYTLPEPAVGDLTKDNEVDRNDRVYLARYLAQWNGYDLPT